MPKFLWISIDRQASRRTHEKWEQADTRQKQEQEIHKRIKEYEGIRVMDNVG